MLRIEKGKESERKEKETDGKRKRKDSLYLLKKKCSCV